MSTITVRRRSNSARAPRVRSIMLTEGRAEQGRIGVRNIVHMLEDSLSTMERECKDVHRDGVKVMRQFVKQWSLLSQSNRLNSDIVLKLCIL